MFLDRYATGTKRREGKLSPKCRLSNRNVPLPSPRPLLYHASDFRLHAILSLPSGIWSQRLRESLRLWNKISTSQRGSRGQEKTKGDEIPLQPSPSNTPVCACGSTTQTPFLNEKIYRYERTRFYYCTPLLTLWQLFHPEQKEISHFVKKGKNCTPSAPFSSLLSFFQSIHIHRRRNLKTLGCLQSIFKNNWPWNVFTFHSHNHCLREVFQVEYAFETRWLKESTSRCYLALICLFTQTQRLRRGWTEIFLRSATTKAEWGMREREEKCS